MSPPTFFGARHQLRNKANHAVKLLKDRVTELIDRRATFGEGRHGWKLTTKVNFKESWNAFSRPSGDGRHVSPTGTSLFLDQPLFGWQLLASSPRKTKVGSKQLSQRGSRRPFLGTSFGGCHCFFPNAKWPSAPCCRC